MGILPIYWKSAAYAREHDERDAYFASKKASIACRDAIETAARNHYRDGYLDSDAILDAVVPDFGYERVMLILAATVREKDYDERFSNENKAWAKTVRMPEDRDSEGCPRYSQYIVERTHSCRTDTLISKARRYLPPACHCVNPDTGELVIVKRSENGFYGTEAPKKSRTESQRIADAANQKHGISKTQAAAMLGGAMHGWNTQAADPRSYDCRGRTICSHPRREQGWER